MVSSTKVGNICFSYFSPKLIINLISGWLVEILTPLEMLTYNQPFLECEIIIIITT